MKASKWSRRAVMGSACRSGDEDLDKQVWEKTKKETKKSWLNGPFTEQELEDMLGKLFVVSRRFGILQKSGIRVIDDFSESMINACFGASETVDLGGVDELAALARTLLDMVKDNGKVEVKISTGEKLEGWLHDSITVEEARSLVGRTLDLESAYKQLLVAQGSAWASVIQVYNTDLKKKELYLTEVLPFGASASVFGFNRFSRALCRIGIRLFGLLWTYFFDDYPHLDLEVLKEDSLKTSEDLLTLLG